MVHKMKKKSGCNFISLCVAVIVAVCMIAPRKDLFDIHSLLLSAAETKVELDLDSEAASYNSPFLKFYSEEERLEMNTAEAENDRAVEAKGNPENVTWGDYLHTSTMPNYYFPKLVLRTLTQDNIFTSELAEPFRYQGSRANSGCTQQHPECTLTWDGWARAIASGDMLWDVLQRKVQGDVVEVGVWKGGISAYFQSILMASGETSTRKLWLVDSFEGLPEVENMTSKVDDSDSKFNSALEQERWAGDLNIGLDFVKYRFERLGLHEEGNVGYLKGFIQDTLPGWKGAQKIALLRIDVDIYSATYDAFHYLYPRLEKGGAVLLDDWKFEYSREAVVNYRTKYNITTPVQFLKGTLDHMAYWIKEEDTFGPIDFSTDGNGNGTSVP